MIQFIAELITRLFGKTPKFFKWIQIISLSITVITASLNALINSGYELPVTFNQLVLKVISICGIVATVISQLTVTTKDKEAKGIKD